MSQLSSSNGDQPAKKTDVRDTSIWTRLKRIKGTGGLANVLETKRDITNPPMRVPNAVINGQRISEFGTSRMRRLTSTWTDFKAFSASYRAPVTLASMTASINSLISGNPPPVPVVSPETPGSFFGQLESILASYSTPSTVLLSTYNSVSEYYSRAPFSFTGSIYGFTSNTVTNDQFQVIPAGAGILIPQFTAITIGDSTYQVENVVGSRLIKTNIISGSITYFSRNSSVTTTGLTPNGTFTYLGAGSSGLATMTTGSPLSITASWNSQTSTLSYTSLPGASYYRFLEADGTSSANVASSVNTSYVVDYIFNLPDAVYDVALDYYVVATLESNITIQSNRVTIMIRSPVTNVAASNITKTSAVLTWDPPISTVVGDNLIGYGIWDFMTNPSGFFGDTPSIATTYTLTGLNPSTAYSPMIRPKYQSGYGALTDNSGTYFQTLYDPPSIVASYDSATRVVSWTTTNPIAGLYYIPDYENTNRDLVEEVTTTDPVTLTEFLPDGYGTPPLSMNMRVELRDINSSRKIAISNSFSVFFGLQVSGLSYSNITDTTFTLSWFSPSTGVTDYIIYKNGVQLAITAGTTYNVTSLSPGTLYNFSVRARYPEGNGPLSDDLTFSTTGTGSTSQYVLASYDRVTKLFSWVSVGIGSYTGGDIVDSRDEGVVINLDSPGNPFSVVGYLNSRPTLTYFPVRVIIYGTNPLVKSNIIDLFASVYLDGLTASNVTTTSITLTWTALSGATSYVIYNDGIEIGTTTGTTYTASPLAFGTTFYFIVKSVLLSGDGPVAGIRVTTLAPTIVATFNADLHQLSWVTTNVPAGVPSPLTYYVRLESNNNNLINESYSTSPVTLPETTIGGSTGFSRPVAYLALVTGGLAKSNSITLAFGDKVSGLSVSNITSTSATLNWSTLSGATGVYRIFNNGIQIRTLSNTASSTTITGLSPNTSYTVEIQPSFPYGGRGVFYSGRKTPSTFTTTS